MRSRLWLAVLSQLLLATSVFAQHLEWQQIDEEGNVVRDLSARKDIIQLTENSVGVLLLTRGSQVAGRYQAKGPKILLAPSGKEVEVTSTWYFHDGYVVVAGRGDEILCYDKDLNDVTGTVRELSLIPVAFLGQDMLVVRRADKSEAVFSLAGEHLPLFDPYTKSKLRGRWSWGLLAVRHPETGRTGVIDEDGEVILPFDYDSVALWSSAIVVKKDGKNQRLAYETVLKKVNTGVGVDPAGQPESEPSKDDTVVRCLNPEAPSGKQSFVLQTGSKRSKAYSKIEYSPTSGVAVVWNQAKVGMIDAGGTELFPPGTSFKAFAPGDPWIAVTVEALTTCHFNRETKGYVDCKGELKIPLSYAQAKAFKNGRAWIAKEIRIKELAPFPYQELYFTENQTTFRVGKGKDGQHSIQSIQTTGKFAQVYSGEFQGGLPHATNGVLMDPRFGVFYGRFEKGQLVGQATHYAVDGKKYFGEFRDGLLEGRGGMWRDDGSQEFVGQFRNGKRWQGIGFIPGKEKLREDWVDGKMVGVRNIDATYVAKRGGSKQARSGQSSMPCNRCNATDQIYLDAIYQRIPNTSLILAGSRYYGSRYTHFGHKETRRVTLQESGYSECPKCRGTGRVSR